MTTLSTLSMDPRLPCALTALRNGDLERTAILARRPELAMRIVERTAHRMSNRIAARALGLKFEGKEQAT